MPKDNNSNRDALVDLLESIERIVRRIDIYTRVPLTSSMDEMVLDIIAELLSMLALATKRLKKGRSSESVLAHVLPLLSATQSNLQRKARWRSRLSCSGSTGSHKIRLGSPQPRLLMLSTVSYRI